MQVFSFIMGMILGAVLVVVFLIMAYVKEAGDNTDWLEDKFDDVERKDDDAN